jgi:hypothetical protein
LASKREKFWWKKNFHFEKKANATNGESVPEPNIGQSRRLRVIPDYVSIQSPVSI